MKETFARIFEQSDIVLSDCSTYIPVSTTTPHMTINMSDIETILIQTAGRWCERYASDLLIGLDAMQESLKEHVENKDIVDPEVFIFGFRRSGVDHDVYVMSNMKNSNCHISEYYNKIYAVKIQDIDHDSRSKTIQITMKDIINNVMFCNINK